MQEKHKKCFDPSRESNPHPRLNESVAGDDDDIYIYNLWNTFQTQSSALRRGRIFYEIMIKYSTLMTFVNE